jgi:stage IV sporulation protein FB
VLLGEPPTTPFDLRFRCLGIPVRVTPFFWLVALLLGYQLAVGLAAQSNGALNLAMLVVLWIAAVFLSLMVHEFGHALAMRYFGIAPRVVLYHFGGLAIPDAFSSMGRRQDPYSQIIITAAGPAAQLVLAAMVLVLIVAAGHSTSVPVPFLDNYLPVGFGPPIPSLTLRVAAFFIVMPSLYWAALNLLPVYPLDGGQIVREVLRITQPSRAVPISLMVSIGTGAAVAIYAISQGDMMLAILFGMLAYSSYMALQSFTGGGFGGNPWGRSRPW